MRTNRITLVVLGIVMSCQVVQAEVIFDWATIGNAGNGTESGVYTIGNGTDEIRRPGAQYFIPNADEWHKAAFHKNDGVTANYWLYATSKDTQPFSDHPPGIDAPDASNSANFLLDDVIDNGYNDGHALTGLPSVDPNANHLSDVGAYTSTKSPYGLFDMAGNAYEWNENVFDSFGRRDIYGGSWSRNNTRLLSTAVVGERANLNTDGTDRGFNSIGFRVASAVPVPEPGSVAITLISIGVAVMVRRRLVASCGVASCRSC